MKNRTLVAGSLVLLMIGGFTARAADEMTRFYARSGSKMRIEGTSNIHDWQVEAPLIGGDFEVGPNFPGEPGQAATPGKIEAHGKAFVTVRSLHSVEKDGKPYSDKMDEVMYEHLFATNQSARIYYYLDGLTLKEAAKAKDAPNVFEAKGKLVVAGVTNDVTLPVNITPLGDKKLKVSGTTTVKMTAYKIEPPAPKIAMGMIKTGDDVKIVFDWMVGQRSAPAAK